MSESKGEAIKAKGDGLIDGKPYRVTWKYKGKEFTDTMVYYGHKNNSYYFKDKAGDFLIATAKMIIYINAI